jgi:F-type H+-transporting ATPase subunit delta
VSLKSVARNYANALFAVASKLGHADEVGRDLSALSSLVSDHGELRTVLESPVVNAAQKRDLVAALLDRIGAAVETRRTFELLAENDRLGLVRDVAAAYQARALDASGVVRADLVTAVPLPDDRQAAFAAALGRATGRRVELTGRVDPEIIGGAVARVGSVVYDGSVTRQLERMKQRLGADV